jgi:hypothetical protein
MILRHISLGRKHASYIHTFQLLTIDIAVAGVSGAMRLITTYMFQLRHNDDFPNK